MLKSLLSADVDILTAVLEGILKENGEEDAEDCWREGTALVYSAIDGEGLGCCTTEADFAVHVFVE